MSEAEKNKQGIRETLGKAYNEDERANIMKDLAKARANLKSAVGNRDKQKYYMEEVRYLTNKLKGAK